MIKFEISSKEGTIESGGATSGGKASASIICLDLVTIEQISFFKANMTSHYIIFQFAYSLEFFFLQFEIALCMDLSLFSY